MRMGGLSASRARWSATAIFLRAKAIFAGRAGAEKVIGPGTNGIRA